jgi:hypothetical protein
MEINEHDRQHQTSLVQYDKLHEHDEDKLFEENQDSCFPMDYLHYFEENKPQKQEWSGFLIKLDANEPPPMIHSRIQFELDQMHTMSGNSKIYIRKSMILPVLILQNLDLDEIHLNIEQVVEVHRQILDYFDHNVSYYQN